MKKWKLCYRENNKKEDANSNKILQNLKHSTKALLKQQISAKRAPHSLGVYANETPWEKNENKREVKITIYTESKINKDFAIKI